MRESERRSEEIEMRRGEEIRELKDMLEALLSKKAT